MPWHQGEPPRDGKPYVVESTAYDTPLFVQWLYYDGVHAFRDWDMDSHLNIKRWHDLDESPDHTMEDQD